MRASILHRPTARPAAARILALLPSTLLLIGMGALLIASPSARAQGTNLQLPDHPSPWSSETSTKSATGSIATSGSLVINGSSHVTFVAGGQISLEPGFTATAPAGGTGITFHAVIGTLAPITFQSTPSGRSLQIDGTTPCTTPCTVQLFAGAHTIDASVTQSAPAGTRYPFQSWSDGGAASHTITTGALAATYTANFGTQYYLTTSAGAGGTISPKSDWFDSGSQATIVAAPAAGYAFSNFTGDLASSTPTQTIALTAPTSVTANFTGDFSLGLTSPLTVMVGQSVTVPVTVSSSTGFGGTVIFDVPVKPTGAGISFSPASVTGSASTTATLFAPTVSGTYTYTIRGTSGGLIHNVSGTLVVQDFALTPITTTATAGAGSQSTAYQFAVVRKEGFSGGFAGMQATIDPTWAPFCHGFTAITLGPGLAPDTIVGYLTPLFDCQAATYPITLSLSSSGVTHTVPVSLTVATTPTFSLSANQLTQSVATGASATFTVNVTAVNGFNGSVGFNNGALIPCGTLTSPLYNITGTGSASFTLNTTGCTNGTYPIQVAASYGSAIQTLYLTLIVGSGPPPDFSITTSASAFTLAPGASNTFTVAVNAINGFNSSVALSASGLPTGAAASFVYGNPSTGPGKALLQLRMGATTPVGISTITLSGTSGGVTRTWPMTLTVVARPDVSFSDLTIPTVSPGGSVTVPVFVTPVNGGTVPQQLVVASDLPPGVTVTVDNTNLSSQGFAMVRMSASLAAAPGAFALLLDSGTGSDDGPHCGGGGGTGGSGGGDSTVVYLEVPSTTTVLNDSVPTRIGPYRTYSPGGTPAQRIYYGGSMVQSCFAGRGITTQISVPSENAPPDGLTFDVIYTAHGDTLPGERSLNCTMAGYQVSAPTVGNKGVVIYDATPRIDSVGPSIAPSGPFTINVTGAHFGSTAGTLVVCGLRLGSQTCSQTADFSVSGVVWQDNSITALLSPLIITSGHYCVRVESLGASGSQFVGGSESIARSECVGNIAQGPVSLTVDSLQVTQPATPNRVPPNPVPNVTSVISTNATTAFASANSNDLVTVLRDSGTVTVTALGIQPTTGPQISWQIDRDPTDTVDTTVPALSSVVGTQTTFQPSAAGGFRIIAFADLNGNGRFDEGEQLRVLRVAVVRATLQVSASALRVSSKGFTGTSNAFSATYSLSSAPDGTSANAPMVMLAVYLLEGGGASRTIGTGAITLGDVGNLVSDNFSITYPVPSPPPPAPGNVSGTGTEQPGGTLPMVDTLRVQTGSEPSGGVSAFRSNSQPVPAAQLPSAPASGGRVVGVFSFDTPKYSWRLTHTTTANDWGSTSGVNSFREFLVAFSASFPRTYAALNLVNWTVGIAGTNINRNWQCAGCQVTGDGSFQTVGTVGVQVLGLSFARQNSISYQ